MRIDFVSDVMCPWCLVGLKSLEAALARLGDAVAAEIRFQPFELNPTMGRGGENAAAHLARKYGAADPARLAAGRSALRAAAAAHGLAINSGPDSPIWNSFDCHRLLHWAGLVSRPAQRALKLELFEAHFTRGEAMDETAVLVAAAGRAGLDPAEAADVLASGRFGPEVRSAQARWQAAEIHAVPAIIFEGRWLVTGGQPVELFEEVIRRVLLARAGESA